MKKIKSREFDPCCWAVAVAVCFTTLSAAVSANMTPIVLAGFNLDAVVHRNTAGPPFNLAAEFNPGENTAFYPAKFSGKTYALPASSVFTSAFGDGTIFQFQPCTGNNASALNSARDISSGAVTLVAPAIYNRVAILANSGGGVQNVTLRFTDGVLFVTTCTAQDCFLTRALRCRARPGSIWTCSPAPRQHELSLFTPT